MAMNTIQYNSLTRQRGMSMISWIIVIAFLLFQGIMAMRVIPVYVNDASVSSIMKKLPSDTTLSHASVRTIRETIEKRLKINNIYDIDRSDIVIKPAKGGYDVTLDYEARGNLIGNMDYVISFNHEATITSSVSE
jgi:hypothetical protein